MPVPKPKPFNRFPQDFYHAKGGSGLIGRTRYTRAVYDGATIRVFSEDTGGKISQVYEAEVAPSSFTVFNARQIKWKDPATSKDYTVMKSTGCGCKYNKLNLSKELNP